MTEPAPASLTTKALVAAALLQPHEDVVRVQRRDLTGVVGIVGIIVTVFGSAVGLGVFFASSIGALDARVRVVEQEVAVLRVEIEPLREDVSAIRTLLEAHVITADRGAD